MSLFKIPKGVAVEIERLQNQFLRRGQEVSKPHLINRKIVSREKENGGLALGGNVNRIIALLEKWFWRFPLEHNTLWAAVIRSKFGHASNSWDAVLTAKSSHRCPWKGILKLLTNFFLLLNFP